MSETSFIAILLFAVGLFSLIGSLLNWDFFYNHRKARRFVNVLGRTGARIFYAILGIGLSVFAVFLFFNTRD